MMIGIGMKVFILALVLVVEKVYCDIVCHRYAVPGEPCETLDGGAGECVRVSPNPKCRLKCVPDPCSTNPCQNGGTCIPDGSEYTCDCLSVFVSFNCEPVPCSSNPCQNGGTCIPDGSEYTCDCLSGFVSLNCETVCVTNCTGLTDGDYHSCNGCVKYASCSLGLFYDNRPCPGGLKWDDNVKRCEVNSNTCS